MRKLLLFCGSLFALFFFASQLTYAQSPVMDNVMIKNGKIYVVVAVLVVIFIGIVLFLFGIERRLKKIEQQENKS